MLVIAQQFIGQPQKIAEAVRIARIDAVRQVCKGYAQFEGDASL